MRSRYALQKILRGLVAATILCVSVASANKSHFAYASAKPNQVAVLIGAPWTQDDKEIMENDLTAMKQSLLDRGFSQTEMCVLLPDNRNALLADLSGIHKKIENWTSGKVFVYYTGHGYLNDAQRPALWLRSPESEIVYWDELFSTIDISAGSELFVLPDC